MERGVPPYQKMGNEPKKSFRINKSSRNEPENYAKMGENEPEKPFRISEAWVRTHGDVERTRHPLNILARDGCVHFRLVRRSGNAAGLARE